MTATPIPRTLSLTAYGDLDATALRELPAGRKPVETWVVGEDKRAGAYEFIRERLREGRQAYVVCPLVAGAREKLRGAEAGRGAEEAERLRAGELRDFEVGLLHGQMAAREKQAAMERFASGETDVLVATSVIEVGIDVANATVMLIEGAERYGLSQLHQLRGRVGRGEHASHCILFADRGSELARRRLEAIARERDGFKLAEVDLALRGEGEILGTRQHGLPRFRVAELPEDVGAPDRGAPRGARAASSRHGSLEAPGARAAARRRPPPLRRRAGRPDRRSDRIAEMRVVAGELKGRRLVAPRGWKVRPTSDRVREAIFSMLGDGRRRQRPRPLLRHRRAGDRGALARRRAGATLVDRDTRPARGNVERARSRSACGARPRRRARATCGAPRRRLRPHLRRRPL